MALSKLSKIAAGMLLTAILATGAAAYTARDSASASPAGATARSNRNASASRRPPPRPEAEILAERILSHGSRLFDAKDSEALAATFTESGVVRFMGNEGDLHREELRQGRAEVERFYRDYFRDRGTIESKNTVDFARLITPELLIIHGRFRPDLGRPQLPFVQMRRKQNDEWLTDTLWLFLQPTDR